METNNFIDEQELIEQLIRGEESAFRYAVTNYQQNMLYVARTIVGPAIADEIVQDAWISIIKALPKFEGRSSLKTWILRIVSNSAKTRLRKESRSIAVGDAQDIEISALSEDRFKSNGHWSSPPAQWSLATPDALLARDDLKDVIEKTIRSLPDIQQTIISLRDMEGMEMSEICKILDVSESNSRVLLHRARTKIWRAIEKHQE